MNCPKCNSKNLTYSQNADIYFEIVDNKLVPVLSEICYYDSTYLFCKNCGANSEDNRHDFYDTLDKFDNMVRL